MLTEPLDYEVVRSKRRRTAAIKVEPGGVRVLVPHWVDQGWIDAWVASRQSWIVQKQTALASQYRTFEVRVEQGAQVPLLDEMLTLRWQTGTATRVVRSGNSLDITLSRRGSRPTEERVHTILTDWYKEQADDYLGDRLQVWIQASGLRPSDVRIKGFRKRWGSCDSKGVIALNWRLMLVERQYVDYVLVHELAHLRHFDHSPRFWSVVANILPQYKDLRLGLQCRYPVLYF